MSQSTSTRRRGCLVQIGRIVVGLAVVLARGRAGDVPGAPQAVAEAEAVWQELQAAQAGLSTQGRLVHATHSGHNIADDAPELVLEAIRSLLP